MTEQAVGTPFIAGGVYETVGSDGQEVSGTMFSSKRQDNGLQVGMFWVMGQRPEKIIEGSDRINSMTLIGRPASPRMGRPRKSSK